MNDKSPDAFRTISEVADWLGVPTHVLRFWESRFTQVKPVKRAGGRRYYRPADMELLGGIRKLLHDDGMTIRGVQKLLREQGVKYVSAMSPMIDIDAMGQDPEDNVVSLADTRRAAEVQDAELIDDSLAAPVDTAMEDSVDLDAAPEGSVTGDDPIPDAAEQPAPSLSEEYAPDGLAIEDLAELATDGPHDASDGLAITDAEAADPTPVEEDAGLSAMVAEVSQTDDPFTSAHDDAKYDLPEDDEDSTSLFDEDVPAAVSDTPLVATEVTAEDDSALIAPAEPQPTDESDTMDASHMSRADVVDESDVAEDAHPYPADALDVPTAASDLEAPNQMNDVEDQASPLQAAPASDAPDLPDPDMPTPKPDQPDLPDPAPKPDMPPPPVEPEPTPDPAPYQDPTPDLPGAPVPTPEPDLPSAPILTMPDIGEDPEDSDVALPDAPIAQRLRALRAARGTLPSSSLGAFSDRLQSLRAVRSQGGDNAPRL